MPSTVFSHALVSGGVNPKAEKHAEGASARLPNIAKTNIRHDRFRAADRGGCDCTGEIHATGRKCSRARLRQYDVETHLPLTHAHGYDHASRPPQPLFSLALWISGGPCNATLASVSSQLEHSRENRYHGPFPMPHSAISIPIVMLGALARDGSDTSITLSRTPERDSCVRENRGSRVMTLPAGTAVSVCGRQLYVAANAPCSRCPKWPI